MTDKNFNEAYKMAEDEIKKQDELKKEQELLRIKEIIKNYKLDQLKKKEEVKLKIEKGQDELRAINLNLENLDKGNFDAIKEISEKSEIAHGITPDWFISQIPNFTRFRMSSPFDRSWISGVYQIFDEHNKLIKKYLF